MTTKIDNQAVQAHLRPIKLAILLSVFGEAIIFLVWGIILYPEGSLINKFLWTIVFCGLGMGSALGAIITFSVVGKFKGTKAIIFCSVLSGIILGVFCNYLCFNLDLHFNYFGGQKTPDLFIWNGIIMSFLGGALLGWLCFTKRGSNLLNKYHL